MDDRSYRWVIVAAGGLLGCVAMGAMFALPVFLAPMAKASGWSRTGISSAMTIAFLAMAFASVGWGALVDRVGARLVVGIGSVLLAISLYLAGRAPSLLAFQLTFGLLVGTAAAAIIGPLMASVTGWFDTHRSLAVSLVSAGMGMAPMTMSPLAGWLITRHDWRTAFAVMAGIVAALMIPTTLLIRQPPAVRRDSTVAVAEPQPGDRMTVGDAFRSTQLIAILLTNFCCCATHSGPIFHTVSYAIACGIPALTAVSIYSVEGLAGMGGRVAFGLLGDRLGAKKVLVAGLAAQAVGALLYVFVRQIGEFYAVAALFGFIYAGIMPLYAVILRDNFPLRMMGTLVGATAMAGSLGMAAGPLAGGWIYDTFANYAWLYVASFGIGIGAFLIALTLRPAPRMAVQSA